METQQSQKNKHKKREYDAQYYLSHKEKKRIERKARYNISKLYINLKLIDSVFSDRKSGTKKSLKSRKEINHSYYLKCKANNNSSPHTYTHTYPYKERIKNKKDIEKLRQSGTSNILKKMIDNPTIRIQTKDKVPKNRKTENKNWVNWWEKLKISELMEKYGEYGARAGRPVKYRGRWYKGGLICLDEDEKHLKQDLPDHVRAEITRKRAERNNKWGIGWNEGKGGGQTYFLLKEPLKEVVIKYGDY